MQNRLCYSDRNQLSTSRIFTVALLLLFSIVFSGSTAAQNSNQNKSSDTKQQPKSQKKKSNSSTKSTSECLKQHIKASAIVINDIRFGTTRFSFSGTDGTLTPAAKQPTEVFIFTDSFAEYAQSLGMKTNAAYIRTSAGKYKYICDIDPNLSDPEEIGKLFGVQTGREKSQKNEEISFKVDPKATMKFKQSRDGRLLDLETLTEQKIDELRKSGTKDFICVTAVIFTKNVPFFTSPASDVIYNNSEGIMMIVRTGANKVAIGTRDGVRSAKLYDLDRTDADISAVLETMQKSNLPNPATLVIDTEMIENEKKMKDFNLAMTQVLKWAANELPTFNAHEGRIMIPNRTPNYLLGDGKKVSLLELFKSFNQTDSISLAELVVAGDKNTSRDYFDHDGKPRYYFVNTRKSALVELGQDDLMKVSSTKDVSKEGIYSRTLTMKNDVRITFGGLSVLNPDFLKSDDSRWKFVVGLSSPNGFTIAVEYKDMKKIMRVSGENIRKNTLNIQDRLPRSVVEMIKVSVPSKVETEAQDLNNFDGLSTPR